MTGYETCYKKNILIWQIDIRIKLQTSNNMQHYIIVEEPTGRTRASGRSQAYRNDIRKRSKVKKQKSSGN